MTALVLFAIASTIILAGVILAIIAVYIKLLAAVRNLKEYDLSRYSITSSLAILGFLQELTLILVGVALTIFVVVPLAILNLLR